MQPILVQGVAMPRLGLGTFRMSGKEASEAVAGAIRLGYRHIDTAASYANEAEVGAGIAASGVARDQLFITTKVWHDQLAPDALRRACEASLARLRLEYVDLYLVHWPAPEMDLCATLAALVSLRATGRARAIGVSNFTLPMLREAVEGLGVPIAANQVEYHPFLSQAPMLAWLRPRGIALVAYAPLARGRVATDPTLQAIGRRHGASPAQVALAWLLGQEGVAAIPKAAHRQSQQANLAALSLRLDAADRAAIAALPKNQRLISPAFAPRWDDDA